MVLEIFNFFFFPSGMVSLGGVVEEKRLPAFNFPNENHNLSRERHWRRKQHISFLQLIFVRADEKFPVYFSP